MMTLVTGDRNMGPRGQLSSHSETSVSGQPQEEKTSLFQNLFLLKTKLVDLSISPDSLRSS